jgi:uncharacterized protein (TIGR00255 family)
MINSMTGFARTETQLANGSLLWEMRSVNHRYLEIQLRLPEGWRHLEAELRQLVTEHISRGKVDASLTINQKAGHGTGTKLNLPLATELIVHLETLAKHMKAPAPVSPVGLLRWPGMLEEEKADPEEIFPAARQGLETTVIELRDSRTREGNKIQEMLEHRCADIENLIGRVKVRLPNVLLLIHQRMADRIKSLGVEPDNERLEQELAIIAQKLDVSEELDRMQAHVGEVRNSFASEKPIGRQLDFLMQEMNREANTLGSKSADIETTQTSVELKVLIEQMREQVQNVE